MAMIPRHLIQKARRRAIEIEASTAAEAVSVVAPKVVEAPAPVVIEAPKAPVVKAPAPVVEAPKAPVVEAPKVTAPVVEAPPVVEEEEEGAPAEEESPFAGISTPGASVTWNPTMEREELLAVAKALGVPISASVRKSKTKIIAALEAAAPR